jgi:diguanylate cyclase (GGDEF)-like protein
MLHFEELTVGGITLTSLYMSYLMCGYAATLALVLAGCRVVVRCVPGLRGVNWLSWALFCALAGVLLLAIRPFAPAWMTILAANEALFVSSLLLYCAAADVLAIRMDFRSWGIWLLAIAFTVNGYFTYFHPSLTARILNSSGTCALYAVATAALLFQYEEEQTDLAGLVATLQFPTMALAWLQVLTAAQHILRCVLTELYPPGDFAHIDLIQLGFSYASMVLNLGTGCGLIWLALCGHRQDLQRIARTDSLTGLLNRRAFEEMLARELQRVKRNGKSLVLLLLDIDRFKVVNDTWGHLAGDRVIRQVSNTLQKGLRPSDALSRVGGEEFVALLRDATTMQAEEIAERLRTEIADLTGLPDGAQITISIGVAQSHPDETPEELFHRCDQAMYRSKNSGRNLVTVSELPSGGLVVL